MKAAEELLGKKLDCFRYASDVGRGFSLRSDVEVLRSLLRQIGANMDFVRKSIKTEDPFYLPFLPPGNKFDIVKMAADNWYTDKYFCNELFNGCNPYTIRVIEPSKVPEEFKEIVCPDGNKINLD